MFAFCCFPLRGRGSAEKSLSRKAVVFDKEFRTSGVEHNHLSSRYVLSSLRSTPEVDSTFSSTCVVRVSWNQRGSLLGLQPFLNLYSKEPFFSLLLLHVLPQQKLAQRGPSDGFCSTFCPKTTPRRQRNGKNTHLPRPRTRRRRAKKKRNPISPSETRNGAAETGEENENSLRICQKPRPVSLAQNRPRPRWATAAPQGTPSWARGRPWPRWSGSRARCPQGRC